MFFCIGENGYTSLSIGRGVTINDAIFQWAYSTSPEDIKKEFEEYSPNVIEGEVVDVEFEVVIKITAIKNKDS